jgi:hypothetical protein
MSQKVPFTGLQKDEVTYYYSLLNEELTDYDCGHLCKDDNGGYPFCCLVENAVPILYKQEFELLRSRTNLWSVWKPQTEEDKQTKKDYEGGDTIFCKCKGVEFCERENRSISCRTFPLEPYIDKRKVMVGLVFMKEFMHGCPLTKKPKDIRQEFIDSHFIFWEKLLLRNHEEFEMYWKSSKGYRISRSKTKKKFQVFLPSHLKGKRYLVKYL